MRFALRSTSRIVAPFLAVVIPAVSCLAWSGSHEKLFDGHTRYMWSRTWHAQNSINRPLTPYYVPRAPGRCNSDVKPGDMAATVPSQYGGAPYPAAAVAGFEPLEFERLGRVPNEMDVAGSLDMRGAGQVPAGAAHR
jgi:hypothetical protein